MNIRLERQRIALVTKRIEIVNSLYQSFNDSFPLSISQYHPPITKICRFRAFDDLINSPADVDNVALDFARPMQLLPGLIATWTNSRKVKLRNIIAANSGSSSEPDCLNLATSVFRCANAHYCAANYTHGYFARKVIIGWESASRHHCTPTSQQEPADLNNGLAEELVFDEKASQSVKSLLKLLKLDNRTTTILDMDEKDDRFLCLSCPPERYPITGRIAFTWRSAVRIILLYFSRSSDENAN